MKINSDSKYFITHDQLTYMTLHSTTMRLIYEKFEDTNGVPRSRKSKKDRQYNGQKKKDEKTINYLQNTT